MVDHNFRVSWSSKTSTSASHKQKFSVQAGNPAAKKTTKKTGSKKTTGGQRKSEPITPGEFFDKARGWLDNLEEVFDTVAQKAKEAQEAEAKRNAAATTEAETSAATSAPARDSDVRADLESEEVGFTPPFGPTEAPPTAIDGRVPALAIEYGVPDSTPTNGLPPTKFGGQPDWLASPQWPVSKTYEVPMEFVAQLALHPDDLPWLDEPKMAYLFITNDEDDPGGPFTWEPFAGENAVIIQPGDAPEWIQTLLPNATGPSVQRPRSVKLTRTFDPPLNVDDAAMPQSYFDAISYDKIGGTPNFFQGLEFPDFATRKTSTDPTAANPILQLVDADAAWVNLGDAGMGVAFLSPNQRQGAYLWFN